MRFDQAISWMMALTCGVACSVRGSGGSMADIGNETTTDADIVPGEVDGGQDRSPADWVRAEARGELDSFERDAMPDAPDGDLRGELCEDDSCCWPQCADRECGDDGCGGVCGVCEGHQAYCREGQCVCVPVCLERECGTDGCGGSCGDCPVYHVCSDDGTCVCLPVCGGKQCGSDNCGGLCGMCGCGHTCVAYQCVFDACDGRECGPDGCGGSCGHCPAGKACVAGRCPAGAAQCEDGNDTDWDGCTAGQITEFLARESTVGSQQNPAVLTLPSGDYYVFWQDSAGDSQSWGIVMRRFPANGGTPSPLTVVNSFEHNAQVNVEVAPLSGGGFVAVWQSMGQDGGLDGVFGQRFSASGQKAGGEFQVNTFTNFDQSSPSAAGIQDGGFVVAWQSKGQDGSQEGIYAQRYDSAGGKVGSEHQVNTHFVGGQVTPSVAGLQDGGYIITWSSDSQDGDGWGVFAQRFDATGARMGSEFQVNTTTYSYQTRPVVAPMGAGGMVILWESVLQDGFDEGVIGQRYSSLGVSGSEFLVNQTTKESQKRPRIASLANGGFVVAWQSSGQDGEGDGVVIRRYDASGQPQGSETLVNEYKVGSQSRPAVASFSEGIIVLAWQSQQAGTADWRVMVRRWSFDATPLWR